MWKFKCYLAPVTALLYISLIHKPRSFYAHKFFHFGRGSKAETAIARLRRSEVSLHSVGSWKSRVRSRSVCVGCTVQTIKGLRGASWQRSHSLIFGIVLQLGYSVSARTEGDR
ncbi:hypothetical protein H6F74_28840 [Trichocoleus sp. FACHB-90]|uniref:hypothetical protein n=1 Tax=Cyanophyceae TaxID=3028117 RepID=UPI0016867C01|nr:hypothetical protein [Trichocoleus sp. FACHB-90]MBD1930196.1 hypothetical protein [Trichocoleus sp. FACHB-90]